MITYNQERFIAQAIESVVMQKTEFPRELVIGEDCSTDNTRIIVESYAKKYPEIIRLISSGKNLGMMANFRRTLSFCRGKYIAMCEGDDYWTDLEKLQKQVRFLEQHQKYAISCHNVLVQYDNNEFEDYPYFQEVDPVGCRGMWSRKPPETTDLCCLLKGNYIQTPSIVMRNVVIQSSLSWLGELSMGDWVINVMAARQGAVHYMDEIMAVYRVHSGGVWSRRSEQFRLEKTLECAYAIREHVSLRQHEQSVLNGYIIRLNKELAQCRSVQNGQRTFAWKILMLPENRTLSFFWALCEFQMKTMLPSVVKKKTRDIVSRFIKPC